MFLMHAQNKVPIERAGGGGGARMKRGVFLKASFPSCDLLSTNEIRDVGGYNQPRA